MSKRLRLFLSGSLLILLFLNFYATPNKASAIEGDGIMVSPAKLEELVQPGETLERRFTVNNNSPSTKKIHVLIKDFTSEGEDGRARLIVPGTEQGSFLSSWIEVSEKSLEIEPFQNGVFTIRINTPKEVGPGGYYGAIVFGTLAPDVKLDAIEKGAAIGISQQAGSLILLQVAGDADERADIRQFATEKSYYDTPFNVKFVTRIENQGNVHIKPQGSIEITNMIGGKTQTIRFNDQGSNILPKGTRKYENEWQGNFGLGKYKAVAALSYGTPANLGGSGMQSLISTTYFWIVPWKVMASIVFGIIFIISVVYLFLKLYKNRAINKAMTDMGITKEYYVKKVEGPSPTLHLGLIISIILILVSLLAVGTFLLFS